MPCCSDTSCKLSSLMPLFGLFSCALCKSELHAICGHRVQLDRRFSLVCDTCFVGVECQNEVLRGFGVEEIPLLSMVHEQNMRRSSAPTANDWTNPNFAGPEVSNGHPTSTVHNSSVGAGASLSQQQQQSSNSLHSGPTACWYCYQSSDGDCSRYVSCSVEDVGLGPHYSCHKCNASEVAKVVVKRTGGNTASHSSSTTSATLPSAQSLNEHESEEAAVDMQRNDFGGSNAPSDSAVPASIAEPVVVSRPRIRRGKSHRCTEYHSFPAYF
jgi:transcription elongation factor Elf1